MDKKTRWEELKSKKYFNLNKDERKEYGALKKEFSDTPMTSPPISADAPRVIETVNTLEKMGNWRSADKSGEKNKTASFKIWRDEENDKSGIVIDWKFIRNDFNEEFRKHNTPIYRITVMFDDGSKQDVEMSLVDFASISEREIVEITRWKKEKIFRNMGYIRKTKKDREGYTLTSGDNIPAQKSEVTVPLNEWKDHIMVDIKRPNGQTFTINADRLNA